METLLGSILPVLSGFLVSGATELAKKTKLPTKFIMLIVAALIGLIYSLFRTYLPIEMQTEIGQFAILSMTSAVTLYEFLLKNLKRAS